MLRDFRVYLKERLVGTVRAMTFQQARQAAFFRYGGASKYSGAGMDSFRIELASPIYKTRK